MSTKISQLTSATDVTANDLIQIVDVEDGVMAPSGTNKKATASLLARELAKQPLEPGVVISGSSSGDAVRITQTGSGNALVVEDSTNPDSTPTVITASGNVGIGTNNPSSKLEVSGVVPAGEIASKITNFSSTSGSQARLDIATATANAYSILSVNESATPSGELSHGSGLTGGMFFVSGTTSAPIVFRQSGSERMRINSSGNIDFAGSITLNKASTDAVFNLISTAGGAQVYQTQSGDYGLVNYVDGRTTSISQSGLGAVTIGTNNAERMRITSSGNVGIGTSSPSYQLELSTDSAAKPSTSTWTISSDERLKENIEAADLDICYNAVKNIPLKRYKWKDEIYSAEQVPDRSKIGWIAQDVQAVFPKAVNEHKFAYNQVKDEDGNVVSEDVIEDCLSLNSDQIYAALFGAVQKLMGEVESLQGRIAELEATP